jgi:hypothetical protein
LCAPQQTQIFDSVLSPILFPSQILTHLALAAIRS